MNEVKKKGHEEKFMFSPQITHGSDVFSITPLRGRNILTVKATDEVTKNDSVLFSICL